MVWMWWWFGVRVWCDGVTVWCDGVTVCADILPLFAAAELSSPCKQSTDQWSTTWSRDRHCRTLTGQFSSSPGAESWPSLLGSLMTSSKPRRKRKYSSTLPPHPPSLFTHPPSSPIVPCLPSSPSLLPAKWRDVLSSAVGRKEKGNYSLVSQTHFYVTDYHERMDKKCSLGSCELTVQGVYSRLTENHYIYHSCNTGSYPDFSASFLQRCVQVCILRGDLREKGENTCWWLDYQIWQRR